MDFTRKDAARLINDDGSVDIPLLTWYLQELPHLWNMARHVNFYVAERMMAEGGIRGDAAKKAIDFSAWLYTRAGIDQAVA